MEKLATKADLKSNDDAITTIANSPSIQTPMPDTQTAEEYPDPSQLPDKGFTERRRIPSQTRGMILAGTFIIMLTGLIQTYYSHYPPDVLLLTAFGLLSWWLVAWKIRLLPINRRTRALDASLKEAQAKLDDANTAKTRFFAIASHEMRTPLNGIIGMSKLLEDTKLTKEQANYNNAIQISGETLHILVENLLDLAALELEQKKLNPVPINLREELENIAELIAPRAFEKDLDIATYVNPNLPETLMLDRQKFRQIINNFIGNAIKFTDSGGISVQAQIIGNNKRQSSLQISVNDTGSGISDRDKARIFNEFEQVQNQSTEKQKGVGLGLSISQKLAKRMGGKLSLLNRPEGGSCFTLELPAVPAVYGTGVKSAAKKTATRTWKLAGRNILIVGEKPLTSKYAKTVLENHGASVVLIGDPDDQPSDIQFDTILCDIKLVQSIPLSIPEIPAQKIALLEPTERANIDQLSKIGFENYLIKPIRSKSLLDIVSSAIPDDDTAPRNSEPVKAKKTAESKNINLKILLAEDNPVNTLLFSSVLKKHNNIPITVENGEMALDTFVQNHRKNTPFDVIYMDMHLPQMNGLDTIKAIRAHELDQQLPQTPIVILSADTQDCTIEDAINSGANEFMAKPIDPKDLIKNLSKYKIPA